MSLKKSDIGYKIRRIASQINLRGLFEKDSKDLLAFYCTIYADDFTEADYLERGDGLSLKECLQALEFLIGPKENRDNQNLRLLSLVGEFICRRLLFVTKDRCLGLGSKAAKPGDIVTILLRGKTTFILRLADNKYYRVIGEVYYYRFIDAKALLGPLPTGFQLVAKLEEKTDRY